MRSRAAAAGMAMAVLAGCGGVDEETDPKRALPVDARLVSAVPDPLAPEAAQAPGTYVGPVGDGPQAIALLVDGDRAVVYLCDGQTSAWLGAPVQDGRLSVTTPEGVKVDAHVEDGRVAGTVDGEAFTARPARNGTGLFAGPDPALPGYTRRWIVLPDAVRGVSTTAKTSGTITAGPATSTTTTPSSVVVGSKPPPATTTTTPSGTTQVTDGTSNTILVGEEQQTRTVTSTTTTPARTVTDGTSNTILVGEEQPVRTTTTPGGQQVTDGTSNTILIGESPANGVTGDGTVRQAPAVVVTSAVPPGKTATATLTTSTAKAKKDTITPPAIAGGDRLTCPELAKLLIQAQAAMLSADKARAAEAAKQLTAVQAQRKQNGCG